MWGCVTTKSDGHGHVVAEANSPPTGKGSLDPDRVEETKANARLIAAAPDLLAALRLTISALSLSTTHVPADRELVRQALRNAFATITKAEGKP